MFADQPGQLQQRGMSRRSASLLIASQTTVSINGEWLEAFWCIECQQTSWYHVRQCNGTYQLSLAPQDLWQQVTGVIDPQGNPSVGEFTKRNAKQIGDHRLNTFQCLT